MKCRTALVFKTVATLEPPPHIPELSGPVESPNDQSKSWIRVYNNEATIGVHEVGKDENETHLTNNTTNTTTTVTMGGRTKGPRVGLHMANGPELELARHAPRTSSHTSLKQRTPNTSIYTPKE